MADSGAIRLSINEVIRQQLGLRIRQQLDISLADGTKRRLNVAGPVRLKFKDRDCITDACTVSFYCSLLLWFEAFYKFIS